ncbi:zinc finger protein 40 isoform X2 [Tachyglossus aculeatus]|uniref:zinc finger protein 40 isoform X2 n=1 Tax=Tachyglossus aculeatus TaxID=9261 RepID=UPI0018F6BB71|nr:zinc finger protein 40 isoform X2 [Tachyglossus aculeatus]
MPRTKQIHPRNLRDKIEEAQKELNGAEDSQKEIAEAGAKGNPETVKGVKRKKIVTENHLKKIPKSPLRNPPQAKLKQNREETSSFNVLHNASEQLKEQNHLPVQNGKQYTEQNGETPNSEITLETPKAETGPSKKLSYLQHSLELRKWRVDGYDSGQLPDKKCAPSSLASKAKTDNSECISLVDCSTSSLCTSTAFDVLLKAMEPELNTLAQKGPAPGTKTEKQRPNKSVRSPSKLKTSTSATNQSVSQQEFVVESQFYPFTSHPAPVSSTENIESPPIQSVSQSHNQQEQFIPKPCQPSQPAVCPSFTRSLPHQENPKLHQVYSVVATSSLSNTPPSSATQALPLNQLVDSSSSVSVSSTNSTQIPVASVYNSGQVASLVNHGVEQMCSLLLKDQKPKKQGKYICEYCNRACAKPSVLLKHIRSHTGERPYPCVTCGFSFKTKSNLYKHKKSHAHAIKLGLVLQPDSSGLFLSPESDKALSLHSDVEESGESDDEGTADERQDDQGSVELEPSQIMKVVSTAEPSQKSSPIPSNPDHALGDSSLSEKCSELQVRTTLPKVVVHTVNISPLRADSPKVLDPTPELAPATKPGDCQVTNIKANITPVGSLEADAGPLHKGEVNQLEEKPELQLGSTHAQLQRQQATDCSQEQGKFLLSPRSLGSTDSGYFSRSESTDQTMSPPAPLGRALPSTDKDTNKIVLCTSHSGPAMPAIVQTVCAEKSLLSSGQMRPPLATKTLEERISKLISDNEALVDDKQLDSVKPRRTSLSRRGSIDSPKSYIFKDSFQFDLKPMGRRTSSSSDIPKSPFTPTEKSKQVFLLSVPSLDCLPITRSNSMPTSSYSAVPANIIPPPHPLRGSQSFDDKIGSFYDDVFVSGPVSSSHPSGHPRTLVRQAAIEDSSASENHALGPAHSVDEGHLGCNVSSEALLPRSKSFAPGSNLEKRKSHQGRGTMFECETCRNRYRKLENFENHKKFYCSELHGPKAKAPIREPEHNSVAGVTQPQILHYRVAGSSGVWEQPPQIRKRRKMKSVGDDDELQPSDSGISVKSVEASPQNTSGTTSLPKHSAMIAGGQQPATNSPIQLVARGAEQTSERKLSPAAENQVAVIAQEKVELKRQGTGISVIQHTNSLSRPSSFEKSESLERSSPVALQETNRTAKHPSQKTVAMIQEDAHPCRNSPQQHQPGPSDTFRVEFQERSRLAASERSVLGPASRLVRQHNIQVPEILVTEEPDKDQDIPGNDPEKAEKFNWPQRSETLSKLPTEKLPPKKKRIRLAEIEHSSAESSFDSTLSRSLSRESSLSHASSFSASLDMEEASKTETVAKADAGNMIPAGSNTLSVPGTHYREMRRAASEQINCTQPSMEISDFRSKSFDCGNMSPSNSNPLVEVQSPKSSPCIGVPGHVPLIERRRGPLVRQISLNIAPENHLALVSSSSFQNVADADMTALPQVLRAQASGIPLGELVSSRPPSQTPAKDSQTIAVNSNSATLPPGPQLLGLALVKQKQQVSEPQNSEASLKEAIQEEETDLSLTLCPSSGSEDWYAPKYQLQLNVVPASQSCPSQSASASLNQTLSDRGGVDQSRASLKIATKLADSLPSSSHSQKPENISGQDKKFSPFVVPVRIHSNIPAYGFPTVTPLPQILVTQDQNQPICKTNAVPMPISEDKIPMPKLHQDQQKAMPSPLKQVIYENAFLETGSRNSTVSESPNVLQRIPVGGLFPQPEVTASSKRMLSPASSLDIAMEKQQKRAKDENGAACTTDVRPLPLSSVKGSDANKQKKPILVRQIGTTGPLEGALLEQEIIPQLEDGSKGALLAAAFSEKVHPGAPEPIKELENIDSSTASGFEVQMSPASSPENPPASLLKLLDHSQGRNSPLVKSQGNQMNIHLQLGTTLVSASNAQRLSFPSLKTATSFTWCYLLKQKPLHLPQGDQKISAYSNWTVGPNNPNPLGLSTKIALSLLNSKQKTGKSLYSQAVTTHAKCDVLVYSSKWKSNLGKVSSNKKSTPGELSNKEVAETNSEQDKENSLNKSEPRRVKIFDGGYKSNEEYVYVRGRGRGKYICEECGIRCKKPSMLKKHIRTHTDVRPYHCNFCNFSFKTKGNLTKHMKSKAHSKKCVDLGVSIGLIDDQDVEESGEKHRFGYERSGYEAEDSDGPDDDDNENEEEDEDSQAESVISATPSVTASPQHHSSRNNLQESTSADEDLRLSEGFSGVHADPMDILPKALLTKMTVLSAVQSDHKRSRSPLITRQLDPKDGNSQERTTNIDFSRSPEAASRSPCNQMSVDYPNSEVTLGSSAKSKLSALTQSTPPLGLPSLPVGQSTQSAMVLSSGAPPYPETQEQKQQISLQCTPESPSPQTHLFSHLPLHSQQQARTPYSMIPIGGIHVVPAGLATYSTFVPIQAGPMQLTIPAVSVIHRTTGAASGDSAPDGSGVPSSRGIAEVNSVVPCIPIGQIGVPGLQNLSAPSLQPLPSLGMETVNILGLTNTNITPPLHPPGLTLNAVGLQVLTANPSSQSNPSPQTHIPGLQILNIALPALIPSVNPLAVDGQGGAEAPADRGSASETLPERAPATFPGADAGQLPGTLSPQGSPSVQRYNSKTPPEPTPSRNRERHGQERVVGPSQMDPEKAEVVHHVKPKCDFSPVHGKQVSTSEPLLKGHPEGLAKSPGSRTLSADRQVLRPAERPRRQVTVQFSDASSDDDEDRLVIAT